MKGNRGNVIPRSQRTIVLAAAKVLDDAPLAAPPPPTDGVAYLISRLDDPDHPHTRLNQDFLDGVVQMTARMIGRGDLDTYELILKAQPGEEQNGH